MISRPILNKVLLRGPLILWLLCAVLAAAYGYLWFHMPRTAEPAAPSVTAPVWPEPVVPDPETWSVFHAPAQEAGEGASTGLASRYRLAGTFFITGLEESEGGLRKAVLDDLDQQRQHLVAEGESFDGIEVAKVYPDHVVLRHSGGEQKLWLSFAGGAETGASTSGGEQRELRWDERVIESNEWGNRIADNRWIIKKDHLIEYYQDVMNDPERLAKLFISMKPVRSKKQGNKITGYVLRPTGEHDFYFGVGMKEGDIVRKVNSMKMIRQERAEYFIKEFVQDRLNAVVLDIDRDGKEQQLIYYIR